MQNWQRLSKKLLWKTLVGSISQSSNDADSAGSNKKLLLQTLVGSILALADKPIVELDFVDDEERQLVMHTFNDTERILPPPYAGATIHGLFEHWATVTPDARAISFEVSKHCS